MRLLNPGPVSLTDRVRQSMLGPDLCHREPEYFDLQDEIRRKLLAVYELDPEQWSAVLLSGSGTAAVESMLTTLVPEDGRVLIVENGVYGERMTQMAIRCGVGHGTAQHDWLAGIDLSAVAARLDEEPGFTHVAVVHHETTTGRLNDLTGLDRLCRDRRVQLLVDGVSSFGAEWIDFGSPATGAVAATANKCLHGVPGVAFVVVRRDQLERAAARSYYLDLTRLARLQDRRDTPFTPAVHACYALAEALAEHEEAGGWMVRRAMYQKRAGRVADALIGAGVHPLLSDHHTSSVLRAYRLPPSVTYEQLHDALKADGFVIYAGQGALSPKIFRVAVMGDLTESDIDRLVRALDRAFDRAEARRPHGEKRS
jgi:2-aminoethylphosphonate-pyruvate transaminase